MEKVSIQECFWNHVCFNCLEGLENFWWTLFERGGVLETCFWNLQEVVFGEKGGKPEKRVFLRRGSFDLKGLPKSPWEFFPRLQEGLEQFVFFNRGENIVCGPL